MVTVRFWPGGKDGGNVMLNYEEELKKFKPSLEVDDIEDAVYQEDLSDMSDLLKQVMDKSGASTRS
jgi:hypothetical protein